MGLPAGALDGDGARLLWYEMRIFHVEESARVSAPVSLAMAAAATAAALFCQLAGDSRLPAEPTFLR